jgi:xanthine/uracil/vitamin C permease (AzgA family)
MQSAHVVVKDEETMVTLGSLSSPECLLALMGLTLIATLHHRAVPGSIIIGIFVTAIGWVSIRVSEFVLLLLEEAPLGCVCVVGRCYCRVDMASSSSSRRFV